MRSWDFLWGGPEPPYDEKWNRCIVISNTSLAELNRNRSKDGWLMC